MAKQRQSDSFPEWMAREERRLFANQVLQERREASPDGTRVNFRGTDIVKMLPALFDCAVASKPELLHPLKEIGEEAFTFSYQEMQSNLFALLRDSETRGLGNQILESLVNLYLEEGNRRAREFLEDPIKFLFGDEVPEEESETGDNKE